MVTSPAHTKHVCFVSHIIIMQESAQVKSLDGGNLVATAADERKGEGEEAKEEREQEGGASSFIKMCLAWRQRSPARF